MVFVCGGGVCLHVCVWVCVRRWVWMCERVHACARVQVRVWVWVSVTYR